MREVICNKTEFKISLEAIKMKLIRTISHAILILLSKYSVMTAGNDNREVLIDDNLLELKSLKKYKELF